MFQCQGKNWETIEVPQTFTIYNDYNYEFFLDDKKVSFKEALSAIGKNFDNSIDFLLVVYPQHNVITAIYLGHNFASSLKIGDSYFLGNYFQNRFNGSPLRKTRIKWNVIDIQGNKALLLSEKILFRYDVSSDLINYLNTDFYNEAFSEIEKEMIQKERVSKIFLLNRKDVSKGYISRKENRCACESDFSIMEEVSGPSIGISRECNWLLEKDSNSTECFYINKKGQICSLFSFTDKIGVRPALWLEIAEPNFTDLGENSLSFIKESIYKQRSFVIKYKQFSSSKIKKNVILSLIRR